MASVTLPVILRTGGSTTSCSFPSADQSDFVPGKPLLVKLISTGIAGASHLPCHRHGSFAWNMGAHTWRAPQREPEIVTPSKRPPLQIDDAQANRERSPILIFNGGKSEAGSRSCICGALPRAKQTSASGPVSRPRLGNARCCQCARPWFDNPETNISVGNRASTFIDYLASDRKGGFGVLTRNQLQHNKTRKAHLSQKPRLHIGIEDHSYVVLPNTDLIKRGPALQQSPADRLGQIHQARPPPSLPPPGTR